MKKFLLTLIVTMLAFVGTWAQGSYDVSINGTKATVTSGGSKTLEDVASEIASNDGVNTVIMPSGWTTSQLKNFADQIDAVKTAVSTTSSTKEVPAYFYDTNKEYTGERGNEGGHITGTVKANVTLTQVSKSYKVTSSGEPYTGTYVFVQGDNVYGCEDGNVISLTKEENVYTYNDGTKKIYDASRGVTSDGKGNIGGNATVLNNADVDFHYNMNGKDYAFTSGMAFKDQNNVYYGYVSGDRKVATLAEKPYTYRFNNADYIYNGYIRTSGSDFYGYVGGEEITVLSKSAYTYNSGQNTYTGITRTNEGRIFGCDGTKVELTSVTGKFGYLVSEWQPKRIARYVIDESITEASSWAMGSDGNYHTFVAVDYTYTDPDDSRVYGYSTEIAGIYEENDNKYGFISGSEFELTSATIKYYIDAESNEIPLTAYDYAYLDDESNEHYFINGEEKQVWKSADDKWYTTNGDGTMPVYTLGRFMTEDDVTYGIENGVLVGSANGVITKYESTANVSFINDGSGDAIYTGAIYVAGDNRYAYENGTQVTLTQETIYTNNGNIYEGAVAENEGNYYGVAEENQIPLTAELTYSYANPSDNKTPETETIQFTSAVPLSTAENAYEVDRVVYLTQGTKEVPAGNELVVYTKEEGCVATYIESLDYSVKGNVNAITLAGEVSVTDLNKVADLSVVAVMDVRETSISNVSGFAFQHWGDAPKLTILAKDIANPGDFMGTQGGNTIAQIISNGAAGSLNVGITDASLMDINPFITSDDHAIILSNYGAGQLAGATLLEKINNLPAGVLNVDLSKGRYDTNFNLSSLTNSYMKYLTLQDETDLAATLNGKTLPENVEIVASARYGVETQFAEGNKISENVYYTHILKQGALNGAEGLVSDAVMQADKVCFSGYMSSADLANFTYNQNKKLDFSQVVFDGTDFTALNNAYVEYIALPNNLTSDFATGTDNVTIVNKTNLPKLKGIGCYTEKTIDYTQNSINQETNLISQTVKNGKCGILSLHDFTGTLEKNQVSEEKSYDLSHNQIVSVMVAEHASTMVVDSLRLSGYLNHNDLINGDGKGITVTLNNTGNKMTPRGIDMSCAYFKDQDDMVLSNAGWAVGSLNFVSFPKDSRMKKIPADCLNNYSNIFSLAIPNHYEYIGRRAFYNLNCLLHQTVLVYESNTDCDPEVLDYGTEQYPYAVTLPASLKYVGTGAYWLDEHISDVYNLAKTAPICEVNSFSSGTLVGWGGFHNVSPITRDSYGSDVSLANASAKSFGILHWPALISEDNVKRYTDITRKYSIVDELQTTDGDGNTYVWPNQSEYNRAYGQASNGYLWTGWGNLYGVDQDAAGNATYYNVVTIDQAGSDKMYTDAVFLENYAKYADTKSSQVFDDCVGVSPVTINNIYKTYGDDTVLPATNGQVTMFAGTDYEVTVDVDYRGWHQFVLTGSAQYEEPTEEPTWDANTYVESDWYTMCVPFDMTEDDCLQIFGVKAVEGTKTLVSRDNGTTTLAVGETQVPLICSLKDVVRDQPNNKITLNFSSNVARTQREWTPYSSTESKTKNQYNDCDKVDDKKIIVKAGYPYLVRVFLPQSGQIDTKYQMVAGEGAAQRAKRLMEHENSSADRDFDNTEKAKKPYDKWSVYSYAPGDKTTPLMDDRDGHTSEPYTYKFVGTYEAADNIPMWAFFLANNGTKNVFYRNIWEPEVYSAPWNANSCMIGAKAELEMKRMGTSTALYSSLKPSLACEDDVFGAAKNETNSGKRAAMFMNFSEVDDDNAATMIEYIEANGHVVEAKKQDVYNLNGVKVSSYGIDGLPKGIYVVNGKKIVK